MMTSPFAAVSLLSAVLVLSGCAAETDTTPRIKAPAAQVAGEPVNCLLTRTIRNTRVHDDYTIDFELAAGKVYRNTLPNRCPGLGFEERFSHSSTTGNLCSVDTITLLHSDGRRGVSCGLGQFVPISYTDSES